MAAETSVLLTTGPARGKDLGTLLLDAQVQGLAFEARGPPVHQCHGRRRHAWHAVGHKHHSERSQHRRGGGGGQGGGEGGI